MKGRGVFTTLLASAVVLCRVSGTSWRSSSPLGAPRSFLVVKKDILNAKSATASLSSTGTGSSGASSFGTVQKDPDQQQQQQQQQAEEEDSGEIARGGHASTRVRTPRDGSFENLASPDTDGNRASSSSSSSSSISTRVSSSESTEASAASPGMSKKERRKKKKEMDGTAAIYAKKLKNRNSVNIRRKVMHAGFGLFFGTLNYLIPKSRFVPGMTILTSATLLMELLRYKKGFGWMNDALHFTLGSSLRKHEMQGKFTGSFYFFLGVTVTSALYPTSCASLGICQLALADPSASYFGRQTRHVYWSRIENGLYGFGRNKGILGFLGGALFCFPFNYRVLSLAKFGAQAVIPGGKQAVVTASLLLGLAGALADLAVPTPALTLPKKILGVPVPPFHVDDNFVVPIFSGYACTKVFQYLNWPVDVEFAKYILL